MRWWHAARFPCTGGPNGALPSGQLMRRIATWSTPSLRAALARMGSMMTIPWMPPGELCALRGGVLVSTVTPRQRMACGWYNRETMRPDEAASPYGS